MDIYYKRSSYTNTVCIVNGVDIYYRLFKDEYKNKRYAEFKNATAHKQHIFFTIMQYFIDDEDTFYNYVDEEFLDILRQKQLSLPIDFRYKSVQNFMRIPWQKMKKLNISMLTTKQKEAMAEYIFIPLMLYRIRYNNFDNIYTRCIKDKLDNAKTDKDYEHIVKTAYDTLFLCKKHDTQFSSVTVMPLIYDMLENDEDISPITNVMDAYNGYSSAAYNFPTIDNLVKQVIKAKGEDRIKLSNNYVNACRQHDSTLLGASINSDIPASWQVATRLRGTILNDIKWSELSTKINMLYDRVPINLVSGNIANEPIIGPAFRRRIKNKSIDEFIEVLYSWFKYYTGKELNLYTLRDRAQELLDEYLSYNSSRYSYTINLMSDLVREFTQLIQEKEAE